MSFAGKACVVTGAGSGIGRGLALELARRGARLALSDVNEIGLAETVRSAEQLGADVHSARLDVSDRDAWPSYAEEVVARFGVVHQIYNNAGIAHAGPVLESDLSEYDRVLGVNLWGVIYGTKAFLPHLVASGDGHVVNVSSVNGFLAQPGASHYCTSKFGVRGFTETLRLEMEDAGHRVGVTSVHPGGIATSIATNALAALRDSGAEVTADHERRTRIYNEKLLKMSPDDAARIILDAVAKKKPRVLVGNDARLLDLAVRLFPARYAKGVLRFERRMK